VAAALVNAARASILDGVRAAIAGAAPPSPVERRYRRRGSLGDRERLDLLCERISAYGAGARRVRPGGLPAAAGEALELQGARRIGVPAGLPGDWLPPGVELVVDDGSLGVEELERLDGALTACTLAIAETGTIVLAAGPRDGSRALTLVPDLHVCVVAADQVVELVPEAIEALAALVRRERPALTFVSGPSATSDIELRRIEGVHGPRTLVVLVLERELP
jgi:L-lactate dehydrogenase complex protein LldG